MALFFDVKTNLLLGDPSMVPVCADCSAALKNLILSASGWRTIFVESGNEEDTSEDIGSANTTIAALMADCFANFMIDKLKARGHKPVIVLGLDARPTGTAIANTMMRVLVGKGIAIKYVFITAAPEIMAYTKKAGDAFVYISASHNPIGHNGIKFGYNDGGVIPGSDTHILIQAFKTIAAKADVVSYAQDLINTASLADIERIYLSCAQYKKEATHLYDIFSKLVISNEETELESEKLFDIIRKSTHKNPLSVVCDMNGSARTLSIDELFFNQSGIGFYAIHNVPRNIVHAIIPEPENLVHCATEMTRLHTDNPDIQLGYMPDCDGDRGNIVFWNNTTNRAEVLLAQEVFALACLSELAYLVYQNKLLLGKQHKTALSVNDPTSMRIEEIAHAFGAIVVRAEVGEANVVNCARTLRTQGYTVRILGEGSNGGNITHPAAVRDPLNTVFALVKLLVLRDEENRKGLFHIWCDASGQSNSYKADFTLADIIATLPIYTTTGVTENRALLHINTSDHVILKRRYQSIFESQWNTKKTHLQQAYGIASWEAISYNGTKEERAISDFGVSGKGGLKILFNDAQNQTCAFLWMRGSGTEPIFRIECDVKGNNPEMEKALLVWHTDMLTEADT